MNEVLYEASSGENVETVKLQPELYPDHPNQTSAQCKSKETDLARQREPCKPSAVKPQQRIDRGYFVSNTEEKTDGLEGFLGNKQCVRKVCKPQVILYIAGPNAAITRETLSLVLSHNEQWPD